LDSGLFFALATFSRDSRLITVRFRVTVRVTVRLTVRFRLTVRRRCWQRSRFTAVRTIIIMASTGPAVMAATEAIIASFREIIYVLLTLCMTCVTTSLCSFIDVKVAYSEIPPAFQYYTTGSHQ